MYNFRSLLVGFDNIDRLEVRDLYTNISLRDLNIDDDGLVLYGSD